MGIAAPSPLTVVHVQRFAGISGSEGHLHQLLTAFDQTRVRPRLLMLGTGRGNGEREYIRSLEAASIRVDRLPIALDLDPILFARLGCWFRRERPHVVHTHLLHADSHAGPAAWLAGVPVRISTKHNDDRFRRRWLIRRLERALASRTSHIVTISDALRRFYLDTTGVAPARVTTILYGYDPPEMPSGIRDDVWRRHGLPAGVPVILSVGRLVEQKGHDTLVRALPRLGASGPPPHVAIAGEGPRRTALARLASELGVPDRVHLLGHQSAVADLMAAATILAHPARWEGFGLVLLEAMAAGLPIVATAVSAIPEVLDAGRSGMLVPPDDPAAMAGALDTLLGSAPRREALAAAGRRNLAERFSAARMARQHEQLYADAFEDGHASR